MNRNERARELIALGKSEAALMRRLAAIQAKRCKLLQGGMEEAELDPEIIALGIAPKVPPQ
jgi:hypothetical protein